MADPTGRIHLTSETKWRDGPDNPPTLRLSLEMSEYQSRGSIATFLRVLANYVDEGTFHPFDVVLEDRTVTGYYDEESSRWVIDNPLD